jgi:hypothetical protein
MANIFTLENFDDFSEKLNIDELYEKKRQYDLNQLALFNKILNRVHVKIKTTSRQKIDGQFCWFLVPEVIKKLYMRLIVSEFLQFILLICVSLL